MKDSVQDVISEFFYSCGGRSHADRDRSSKHSLRKTPDKSGLSYHRMSEAGSDVGGDERGDNQLLPHGEIENDNSFEPSGNRSVS